jgi:hypothetical protein
MGFCVRGWVNVGQGVRGGVGEEWARGGLIISFNIYISHVKNFTSKNH